MATVAYYGNLFISMSIIFVVVAIPIEKPEGELDSLSACSDTTTISSKCYPSFLYFHGFVNLYFHIKENDTF